MISLNGTGRNSATGVSGGIAYLYGLEGKFPSRCSMGLVGLEAIGTPLISRNFNKEVVEMTDSSLRQEIFDYSNIRVGNFVEVMPLKSVHDYWTRFKRPN